MSKRTLLDFAFTAAKKKKKDQEQETESENQVDITVVSEDRSLDNDLIGATVNETSAASTDHIEIHKSQISEDEDRKSRIFQPSWLKKWPWLRNKEDGMRCAICLKHKKKNTFTLPGCFNFRTSTFERHELCI
jgi:hypothetical protein